MAGNGIYWGDQGSPGTIYAVSGHFSPNSIWRPGSCGVPIVTTRKRTSSIPATTAGRHAPPAGLQACGQRYTSHERPILATPLLIKGRHARGVLARKLLGGIRVACAKRQISAADIERMAGEIESNCNAWARKR